ncbi:MAG: sugar phosphate isomerase/epimerase family protein [Limisphaerales bacterium]
MTQHRSSPIRRREFLSSVGGLAAVSFLGSAGGAEAPPATAKAKIRVGCLSWCFHGLGPAADPEPAIDLIGGMGFDGIELILTASNDIKTFWTDGRIGSLKSKLARRKLQVSQFAVFQPVVEGLSSTERDERERALDHFEAGCRIAAKLGSPLVNIVAPWARELKGPGGYLPRYYDIPNPAPGQKFRIDIAEGFDWARIWSGYVETTRACLARAKAHGLKFSIENHNHTLLPDTGSFLRLWDSIRDPDLGINLDVGWALLGREYPPVAVHKVRGHLLNLHMRDIDGLMRSFPPIGDGVMDFQAIVAALKQTGFDGFASLEQDSHPGDRDMKETCQRYLRMMREYIG